MNRFFHHFVFYWWTDVSRSNFKVFIQLWETWMMTCHLTSFLLSITSSQHYKPTGPFPWLPCGSSFIYFTGFRYDLPKENPETRTSECLTKHWLADPWRLFAVDLPECLALQPTIDTQPPQHPSLPSPGTFSPIRFCLWFCQEPVVNMQEMAGIKNLVNKLKVR